MLDRFTRLHPLLERPAGLLPGGGQQMLGLARGRPARSVLLLDEPGPAPAVAQELFEALSRHRDEGLILLLVDQMADLALPPAGRSIMPGGGSIGHVGAARDHLGPEAA